MKPPQRYAASEGCAVLRSRVCVRPHRPCQNIKRCARSWVKMQWVVAEYLHEPILWLSVASISGRKSRLFASNRAAVTNPRDAIQGSRALAFKAHPSQKHKTTFLKALAKSGLLYTYQALFVQLRSYVQQYKSTHKSTSSTAVRMVRRG